MKQLNAGAFMFAEGFGKYWNLMKIIKISEPVTRDSNVKVQYLAFHVNTGLEHGVENIGTVAEVTKTIDEGRVLLTEDPEEFRNWAGLYIAHWFGIQ